MNKDLEVNIIFYACSTFIALFFAVMCRLNILPLGGDNFTNNTLFVAYFIGVMVLSMLIRIAFTEILQIIFKPKVMSTKADETEEVEVQIEVTESTIDIATIRKKFRNEEATLIKLRCNLSPNEE